MVEKGVSHVTKMWHFLMAHPISNVFENSFCSVIGNVKCDVLVKYEEKIPPGGRVARPNSGFTLME